MFSLLRHLRLTAAIAALSISGILLAGVVILGALFVTLSGTVQDDADAAVRASTRIAAQILQVNLPSLEVTVAETGEVTALTARSMPRFRTNDMIDAIAGVAG